MERKTGTPVNPERFVIITLRLPESLRRAAKAAVAEEGTSLQAVLSDFLRRWVAERRAA